MLSKVLEAVDCDGGTEEGRSGGGRSGFDRALGICCRVFRLIEADDSSNESWEEIT